MALSSTYTYKVLKSSWGILISITAEVLTDGADGAHVIPVTDDVVLVDATADRSLSSGALAMLARGLMPLANEIMSCVSRRPVMIAVQDIRYNDCDFQEEGLAATMFGWAIAEFDLESRDIPVAFNKEANKYVFQLPNLGVE